MATFYSSSPDQRDTMPTVYLRDMEPSANGSMLYLNYPSSGPYADMLAANTQSQQNCINLPIPGAMIPQNSSAGPPDLVAWRDRRNEDMLIQTIGGSINGGDDLVRTSVTDDPQMALRAQLGFQSGQSFSLQQSNVSAMQGQGLSLSLSTHMPVPSFHYQPANTDISILSTHQSDSGNVGPCGDDGTRNKPMHMTPTSYGISTLASTIPNSKYLKATQQLLDEVVNVRKALKSKADKSQSFNSSAGNAEGKENDGGSKSDATPSNPPESTANSSSSLSPSEKQDLQNKITKLLAMLDEVDRRYKQYYHQMQIVVTSFDVIAGCGAAKPYTALALQTISRHFRCLRDSINGQIRSTRKSLGEEDSSNSKGGGISRLRYIDQQIRQQRAMQQLGMMQPHAWRPQRGLPETSVSILRAWLFEHFLHPYPKDSEKLMLARQTGLTRSQVSNWFINARVRLWKPMIEEMYKEENGDTEMDSNSSSGNLPKVRDETKSSEDREDLQSPVDERSHTSRLNESSVSNLVPEVNIDQTYMNQKLRDQRGEDSSVLQDVLDPSNPDGRFMAYHQMSEFGSYGNGGVSLTLGLQHPDGSLLGANNQQGFLSVRGDDMYNTAPSLGPDASDYDYVNLLERRQKFGPSQILHDFVA